MKLYGLQALPLVVCAAALVAAGCGSHQPPRAATSAPQAAAEDDSLETAIGKIRRLQMAATAESFSRTATIESQPGELRDALGGVGPSPGGAALRRVAEAYYHAGILDTAYAYFARALKIDRRDGAAYDGTARIWRDWGFPDLGLGDAYRATFYAPRSAAAHNTLGTVLHALGNPDGARREFERALALDPTAAYALNNVCYLAVLAGDSSTAIDACGRALAIDSRLASARNNLALAFASRGDLAATAEQFSLSGDAAAREFNLGVVLSAVGRYKAAEESFHAAAGIRPGWTLARDRARQAKRLADAQTRAANTR